MAYSATVRPTLRRAIAAGAVAALGLSVACTASSERAVVPSPHRVTVMTIPLGRGRVDALAFDGTTLWVCSEVQGRGQTGTLWPVDPNTARLSGSPVKVPACAGSDIAAVGYLWSGGSRIDPVTGRSAVLRFHGQPEAYLDGSLWTSGMSGLVRIDPTTERIQTVVYDKAMETPGRVVGMDGSVWFAFGDRILRVDPATNKIVATVPIDGQYPNAMATGAGSVWIANAGEGRILRIDPATNRISATVRTGADNLLDVVVAYGSVWAVGLQTVKGNSRERLWEIDPRTNRVIGHAVTILPPGHDGFPLVAAGESLWVGDAGECRDAGPPRARLVRIDVASLALGFPFRESETLQGAPASARNPW
jgi:streptogramin lyase